MKKSLSLHLKDYHSVDTYLEGEIPALCNYTLHEFFFFPQDTPHLTVNISHKPTEDSYEVRMPEDMNSMQIHYNGNWYYTTMFPSAKKLVEKLCEEWKVESVFVTLEY